MEFPAAVMEEISVDTNPSDLKGRLRQRGATLAAKRCFDIAVSLIVLAAYAPVMVSIALAVRWSSPGPAIFRQKRVGVGGTEFEFLKFRTMYADAANMTEAENLAREGILYKGEGDPRVTPLGKFLRRFSLDELPQLYNVLRGDMSLVGPRPLVPFMLQKLPEFAAARSLVRPGITGLWQIRARAQNTSAHYMVSHDLEYVSQFSLWLDLRILAATIGVVFRGEGAV
jgi:lipopolysaccharide/colanic/teichoic acid biosynthesis glycosyltransferase